MNRSLDKVMMRGLLILAVWGALAGQAWALSYGTPESTMVGHVAMYFKLYQSEYGALPTQWSDLEKVAGDSWDRGSGTGSIIKRYAFVPGLEMGKPEESQMLVVMRKPSYETTLSTGFFGLDRSVKGPGRYVIYRIPEGDIRHCWLEEKEVARIFTEAKQPLPVPDDEPETGPVASARAEMYFRRGLYTLVVLGLAGGLLWKMMRRPRTS